MPPETPIAEPGPLVLAVTFYFPPAPQTPGLRARELLSSSGLPVVLLRGHQPGAALLPVDPEERPFVPLAELLVARQRELGKIRLWTWLGWGRREPGTWREWVVQASRACLRHLALSGREPRVVVSFGPPAASHLAACSLADALGLPWVAVCGSGEEAEQAEALAEPDLLLLDGPTAARHPELRARQAQILPPGPEAAEVFKEAVLQAAAQEKTGKGEAT